MLQHADVPRLLPEAMSEGCVELALPFSGCWRWHGQRRTGPGGMGGESWWADQLTTSLAQIQVLELTLTSTIYELLEHVKGSVLVLHCLHDSGQQLGI